MTSPMRLLDSPRGDMARLDVEVTLVSFLGFDHFERPLSTCLAAGQRWVFELQFFPTPLSHWSSKCPFSNV